MEQKHTPEPWPTPLLTGQYNWEVNSDNLKGGVLSIDDYKRARVCVNACAGIEDPQAAIELLKADHQRALKAEAERDEALAALRGVMTVIEGECPSLMDQFDADFLFAGTILAKHGG